MSLSVPILPGRPIRSRVRRPDGADAIFQGRVDPGWAWGGPGVDCKLATVVVSPNSARYEITITGSLRRVF